MVSSIGGMSGIDSSYISQMQEKMLKAIDTNGDGLVSKEEFVSNRPKNVSEDQATQMWSQLDTENSGSLTASEFISAMQSQGPPPGPPPGSPPDGPGDQQTLSVSSSDDSSASSATKTNELLQALLEAIKQYTSNRQSYADKTATTSSVSKVA